MEPASRYLDDLFSLEGKTAIVAGGAGVIGTIMSETLLKAGARVAIWSRSQQSVDDALETLGSIIKQPERMKGYQVDTGDETQVKAGIAQVEKDLGAPGILINAVGGNSGKSSFIDTDVEQFERILSLNLTAGLVIPTKVVTSYWIERQLQGSIINLTSVTSYKPLSGVWAYDAAKAGVLNLTEATAAEFAPYGIRVNAISPGFFLGKQNKALLVDQETGDYTERGRQVISRTPYGRFGEPQELAGATLFLASQKASGFVSGVSIPVDGGFLADNI